MKYKLKQIAEIINGSTPSTSNSEYWDGDISWITPKDMSLQMKRYISNGERNITQKGYDSCSTTLVPKDTILLTSRAPIGYISIAQNELCTNQGFKSIICGDKVLPLFMYYWLSTKVDFLKSISNGATFKELSKQALENVEIDLPNLETQQHIVDTIGSVDDLIEKNDKIIELTKRYIHQIYRSFDFNSTEKTLQDEFNISIGRTPPTKEHQWFDNGNYKWLSIKDMKIDGDFCFETSQYLTNEAVKKFNIPIVNPGDVLLSFKLTVGRIAISNCNMVTNEAIACFKFKDESLRWYLYCYLNNCNFLNDADNTSSIGQAINSSIIKKYKFLKPSNEKLTEFNNIVKPLFNYVKTKREENIYLLQSKQNLLKKYFG